MNSRFIAVVKEECETCQLVVPVLTQLQSTGSLAIYSQDNPVFPSNLEVTDDTELGYSWAKKIETVPTLIRLGDDDREEERIVGWDRKAWQAQTGQTFDFDGPWNRRSAW